MAVKEAEEKIFTLLTSGKNEEGMCLCGNTGSCVLSACIAGIAPVLNGGIVTSSGEHPALLCALKRASLEYDLPVYTCPVERSGALDQQYLCTLLQKEKIALAAFHHIQSETGFIQDLAAIRSLIDQYSPKTLFLADTIQSAGKYPLCWKEAGLDFAFVSGQKIGSPGGAALLYRKEFRKIFASLRGEFHLPGRCTPGNILILSEILEKRMPEIENNLEKIAKLKKLFLQKLKENELPFIPTIAEAQASKYILHLLTTPYQGAILTRMLAEKNISISPGSACESETKEPSRILQNMGIRKSELYNALRISFWHHNKEEEIPVVADALKECTAKY